MIRPAACLLIFLALALPPIANAQEPSTPPVEQAQFVSFELITNLRDADHFLKLEISVEVTSPAAAAKLSAILPRVRDSVIELVGTRSYAEVIKPDEKKKLKQEVTTIVSKQLGPEVLKTVYFNQFLAQ